MHSYIVHVCIHVCKTFIQSITKELTPNFQGFTNLSKAHTVMKEVAEDINETKRLYDRTQVSTLTFISSCPSGCIYEKV